MTNTKKLPYGVWDATGEGKGYVSFHSTKALAIAAAERLTKKIKRMMKGKGENSCHYYATADTISPRMYPPPRLTNEQQ